MFSICICEFYNNISLLEFQHIADEATLLQECQSKRKWQGIDSSVMNPMIKYKKKKICSDLKYKYSRRYIDYCMWRSHEKMFGWAVKISIKHKVDQQKLKFDILKIQNNYLYFRMTWKCNSKAFWNREEGKSQDNFFSSNVVC